MAAAKGSAPSEITPLSGNEKGAKPGLTNWVASLQARLPCSLLACIFITHHLLKGLVAGGGDEGLIGKPIEFLLGAQHVPAHRMQGLVTLGGFSPWVLKPLIGTLSDTVPIYGYKKNPYILIMTALALISCLCLGLGLATSTGAIIGCLFFASLLVAGSTLMVDAKRSEIVKQHPSLGPEIVSFTETGMNLGIIGSAMLVGPLIHYAGPRTPYFVALPLLLAPIALVAGNWLQDQKVSDSERDASTSVMRKNPWLFSLGLSLLPLMLALGLGAALNLEQRTLVVIAGAGSVMVVAGYGFLIRPEISGPLIFYFIFRCLCLHINGALFYFYTDCLECFPEGPHVTPFFYASVLTIVAISGRMLGFMTAKDLFGGWHYARVVKVTMPLAALTGLSFVPLLMRWNVKYGIPDQAWLLTCTFVDMVVRGWRHFPFSVLLLQATPKGLEASTLALNCGAANFGITLSSFFGGYALSMLGVVPAGHPGESANFDNLWKVQAIAALLPLLCIPLMPALIPKRRQNEALIQEMHESATWGAPIERWIRRRTPQAQDHV